MEEHIVTIITKMQDKMNKLVVYHNYDLQHNEIQKYSKKLDRAILLYSKINSAKKKDYPIQTLTNLDL